MATANTILPPFKQNLIDDFIGSLNSPILGINILAGGSGYANGEALVFTYPTGTVSNAAGLVVTSNTGQITAIALTNTGSYNITPNVTIQTANGFGGQLTANVGNDNFYLFVGRSLPYTVDTVPDPNYENPYNGGYFHQAQMYYGIKMTQQSFAYMAPSYKWTSGTVYAQYDDKDVGLTTEQFYVLNSANVVFKCINNNQGANSTIEPTSTAAPGNPFQTSDGYEWMYLYQLSSQQMTQFSTPGFIPILPDANVTSAAVSGSIYNINITAAGNEYPWNTGTLGSINGQTIAIAANASSQNNYYANCTLTVFGAGNIITNLALVSSYLQGNTIYVVTANSFNANQATQGDVYQIAPTLAVKGSGTGCQGYILVNPTSGSLSRVVIFNPGSGYEQASAVASSGAAFGTGATLRPIISPAGGHGANVYAELFSEYLGITGTFANTLNFSTAVTMRTVGILQNPIAYNSNNVLYSNTTFNQLCTLSVANTSASTFSPGETIIGNISQASGISAFSNSSTVLLSGLVGNFIDGEILRGQTSGVQYTLSAVVNTPSLDVYSGSIIFADNILPAPRSDSTSQQLKLVLRL